MRKQGTAPNPSLGPALGSAISTRWRGRGSAQREPGRGLSCSKQQHPRGQSSRSHTERGRQLGCGRHLGRQLSAARTASGHTDPASRPRQARGLGRRGGGGAGINQRQRVGAWAQRPASCAEEEAAAPKGRSGLRLAARGLAPGVPKGAPRPGFRSVRPRGEKVTGPDSAETGGVLAVWVWSPASPAAAGRPGPGPNWERRAGSLRKETRGLNFMKSLPKLFRDVYRAGSMGTIQNAGFGGRKVDVGTLPSNV